MDYQAKSDKKELPKKIRDHLSDTEIRIDKLLEQWRQELKGKKS